MSKGNYPLFLAAEPGGVFAAALAAGAGTDHCLNVVQKSFARSSYSPLTRPQPFSNFISHSSDGDTALLRGVPVADGDGAVFHGVAVNGDAERGSGFILPAA